MKRKIYSDGHVIDTSLGAEHRNYRKGNRSFDARLAFHKAGGMATVMKPTTKRRNIMSMLATGWLPWGRNWQEGEPVPNLPLCMESNGAKAEYVMCCGHVMKPKEAQDFVELGLLMAGPRDRSDRPTLVITETGRWWLSETWWQ